MEVGVTYDMGSVVGYAGDATATPAVTVPLTLTTSEQDLLIVKKSGSVRRSQFTAYFKVAVSGFHNVNIKYYYSPNITAASPDWYVLPIKNASTGELANTPSLIDTGSWSDGTNYLVAEDIAVGACTAFKITAYTATLTASLVQCYLMGRDN